MRNKKGFTLIELLAVIVILGLLLAIAIPSITRYINQSRKKTLVSSIDSYVSSVIIDVNNQDYNFSELNTIFAIPINCVSLEKGGKNPLGDWSPVSEDYWAYVLVQYDSINFKYIYGFTFKDSNGYGLYPTTIDKLSKDGSEIKTGYTDLNLPVTDLINKSFSSDKLSDFNVYDKTRLVVLESDTCEIPKPCVGEGTEVGDLITCDIESFNVIESS